MSRLRTSNQLGAATALLGAATALLIAKEIASIFGSNIARPLHVVANDKKGPCLSHRLFLG